MRHGPAVDNRLGLIAVTAGNVGEGPGGLEINFGDFLFEVKTTDIVYLKLYARSITVGEKFHQSWHYTWRQLFVNSDTQKIF